MLQPSPAAIRESIADALSQIARAWPDLPVVRKDGSITTAQHMDVHATAEELRVAVARYRPKSTWELMQEAKNG